MRIVVWNCQMGLAKKFSFLAGLNPDIAIVPESADPGRDGTQLAKCGFAAADWMGDNPSKGLGVYAFGDYRLQRDSSFDAKWQNFLPVNVSGPTNLSLLAVWAFNRRTRTEAKQLKAPTRAAINYYTQFLAGARSIIAGDFNNSPVWDKPNKESNFRAQAQDLADNGFASAYHHLKEEDFGDETQPTHFWCKGRRYYHIDYCFVSKPLVSGIRNMVVGTESDWTKISDHAPLVVDFETFDPAPLTRLSRCA